MGVKTTRGIAEFICSTGYEDFGPELVEYTKRLGLCNLGMSIAGAVMDQGLMMVEYVKGQKAAPEAGVLGTAIKTSVEYAALANGTLVHATELEDVSFPEGQYTCTVFPGVFSLGEKLKLSGKSVLEGLILGHEVSAKLALACIRAAERGWLNGAVWSSLGMAAAAAKMLRLNVDETVMALSLAASQAGGIARQTGTGAHLFEAGAAARNGICAAYLAKCGFTGNPAILEGPSGLCELVSGEVEFDLSDASRTMEIGMKKYPCCYLMHRNIDGVFDLIKEHGLKWDDVDSVEVGINHTVSLYLKYAEPGTGEDARFSIPHVVAAGFLDGEVFLPTFTDEKVRDPRFKEARKKVKVVVHPEWPHGYFAYKSPLTIRLKNGSVCEKICVSAKGDPCMRLSDDEIMKKYMDCITYAGTLPQERAERVAAMALAMEEISDISALTDLLMLPEEQSAQTTPHRSGR